MFSASTCEKCRRKIKGRIIYAGGGVWHPACFPSKKPVAKKRAVKKRRR